jgi:serine protease Do
MVRSAQISSHGKATTSRRATLLFGAALLIACAGQQSAFATGSEASAVEASAAPAAKASPKIADSTPLWQEGDGSAAAIGNAYDPARSLAPLVTSVRQGVVRIETSGSHRQAIDSDFGPLPFPFGMSPGPSRPVSGMGSGFVIRADGLLITNNHVVDGAEALKVTLADGQEFEAKVIGTDPQTDIALLQLKDAKNLSTVRLGSSEKLAVGDWVVAIGAPLGLEQTVTRGILSAKGRGDLGLYENGYVDFLQTDAAISPGNSGGPLFNLNGEVVGINSAVAARGNDLGFAVPIDQAKRIVTKLYHHGKVERGWLGLIGRTIKPAKATNERGALVEEVQSGGPADKAGIQAKDRIVSIGGQSVEDFGQLRQIVANFDPGQDVEIQVIRNEKKIQLKVHLEKQPSAQEIARAADPRRQKRGSLFGDERPRLGIAAQPDGKKVIVRKIVEEDGIGAALGLEPGDEILAINGQKIDSLSAIGAALEKDSKRVTVKVRRNGDILQLSVVAR